MTLWDFLDTCQCNQELYIYLTKNAGKPLALAMGMDRRCRNFA